MSKALQDFEAYIKELNLHKCSVILAYGPSLAQNLELQDRAKWRKWLPVLQRSLMSVTNSLSWFLCKSFIFTLWLVLKMSH